MNPPLPNALWVESTKIDGWAVCFDPENEHHFLRKMEAVLGAWRPRCRLSVEEMVQVLDNDDPRLERFKPIVQKRLDEIHALLREQQQRAHA